CGIDVDSDLPCRISRGIASGNAKRDDFLFQADLQPRKWYRGGPGEFQLQIVQSAAEERAASQLSDQRVDGLGFAGERAVDTFMGQQHAAFQRQISADGAQRVAQL